MAATRIRISTRETGRRIFVNVYIYDTIEELQTAARRFSPDDDTETFEQAAGVAQHRSVLSQQEDGTWGLKRGTYIVRLQTDRLGIGVVTHEINHMVMAIWGDTLQGDEPIGEAIYNGYETLAYLQGELTRKLVIALWAHKYYT